MCIYPVGEGANLLLTSIRQILFLKIFFQICSAMRRKVKRTEKQSEKTGIKISEVKFINLTVERKQPRQTKEKGREIER